MSLKDIEKLKEKVDKDPNSKLFVPLAEEYRKEGMLDEAIAVLLSGIEKQPGYMSARVSLGKIYVEKEMLKEAQSEFEQVIKSIPDNLYAHKKLADIYRATGNNEQAIHSYKTVLKLNAMDEDALVSLSELEGLEPQAAPQEEPAAAGQSDEDLFPPQEMTEFAVEEPAPVVGFVSESDVSAEPIREEDLAAFQSAIFGADSEDLNATPADLLAPDTEPYEAAVDAEMTVQESAETATADVFDLDDFQEDAFGEALAAEEPAPDAFTLEQTTIEPAAQQQAAPQQADRAHTFEEEARPSPAPVAVPASAATLPEADRQVSEGNYGSALSIYRALLAANPDDRQILQRVEELRQFLKMIGKDKEALIDQLNTFMEGIEKRRDEFHRNS